MKKILLILLLLFSVTTTPVHADDSNLYVLGNLVYQIQSNGEVLIVGYYGKDESVTIPDTIAGHTVTGIAAGTFTHTTVKNLSIPESVTNTFGAIDDEIKVTVNTGGTTQELISQEESKEAEKAEEAKKETEESSEKEQSSTDDSKKDDSSKEETSKDSSKDNTSASDETKKSSSSDSSYTAEEVDTSYFGDDEGVGIIDSEEKYDEVDIELSEEEKEEIESESGIETEETSETSKKNNVLITVISCVLTVAFVVAAPFLQYLVNRRK